MKKEYRVTSVLEPSEKQRQQALKMKVALASFLIVLSTLLTVEKYVNVPISYDVINEIVEQQVQNKESNMSDIKLVTGRTDDGELVSYYDAYQVTETPQLLFQKMERTQDSVTGEYGEWDAILEISMGNDTPTDTKTEKHIFLGVTSNNEDSLAVFQKETREKNEDGFYGEWVTTNNLSIGKTDGATETTRYIFVGMLNKNGENTIFQKETIGEDGKWKIGNIIINPDQALLSNDEVKYTMLDTNLLKNMTKNEGKGM